MTVREREGRIATFPQVGLPHACSFLVTSVSPVVSVVTSLWSRHAFELCLGVPVFLSSFLSLSLSPSRPVFLSVYVPLFRCRSLSPSLFSLTHIAPAIFSRFLCVMFFFSLRHDPHAFFFSKLYFFIAPHFPRHLSSHLSLPLAQGTMHPFGLHV